MIVVKKGKEPRSLLEFRLQNPDADYESDIPTNVLKDIREQMWNDQVCLCGYCMKRIDSPGDVRVEHCRPRHPQGEETHDNKEYKADGSIYSDDVEINKDVTETLNLNCQALSLPQTRRSVLMAEKTRIMKKCKGKSRDAFIRELERTYEKLAGERNLTPYCGIIISWLENKLKIS